jgi:hypothetical protein
MLRFSLAALAACALAACGAAPPADGALGAGYTLIVRADEAERTYVVAHEDGRIAAARVAEGGEAALLGQRDARAMLAAPTRLADVDAADEKVAIDMPGFSLKVSGGEDAEGAATNEPEHARVSLSLGGKGVEVDALDGEGGETERANVRISGADEKAARDFIAHADELPPAVQAEMLEVLGL